MGQGHVHFFLRLTKYTGLLDFMYNDQQIEDSIICVGHWTKTSELSAKIAKIRTKNSAG